MKPRRAKRVIITITPESVAALDEVERSVNVTNGFIRLNIGEHESVNERTLWRKWFTNWCVQAVCRAAVDAGTCPIPLAVDLKPEAPEDTAIRVLLLS